MDYHLAGLIKEIVKPDTKVFILQIITHGHCSNFQVSDGATVGSINSGTSSYACIEPAFIELAQAAKKINDAAQAREAVERIEELKKQAQAEGDQRKGWHVKSCLDSLEKIFSTAGGLATVWATWGPNVARYFGL